LERGRYYRRKQGSAKTNKHQPTVPIPSRLLAHLRRWHRIDPEAKHFVEFNGKPVTSVKTAFKSAVSPTFPTGPQNLRFSVSRRGKS